LDTTMKKVAKDRTNNCENLIRTIMIRNIYNVRMVFDWS